MGTEIVEQATLTVDAVIMAYEEGTVLGGAYVNNRIPTVAHVLLINGKFGWSLPGGKVRQGERVADAFVREVYEETGLHYPFSNLDGTEVGVFSAPGRDERGRYVSFAYRWIVPGKDYVMPVAGSDAKEVRWFRLDTLPHLAFDHLDIIEQAVDTLPNGLTSIEVRRAQR